jgi:molybdopterin converting factor subunit 1
MLLYFGQARDASGKGEEKFSVPTGSTVGALIEQAVVKHSNLRRIRAAAKMALNEEMATGDEPLEEGDVVALLPPVAGG